ncbi:MAG: hypothetical protein HYS52_01665 [Candidatus Wildermuthbacteria bacterium]|nr:hypothetical protein [Candidatus Wildermuthbacteria bacterium]
MTLDFFKQRYGYEIGGTWMPRVTAVTAMVSKAGFFASQESTDWGSTVHEAIGRLIQNENDSFDAGLLPSLKAFRQWSQASDFTIESPADAIEKRVFDKDHLYAGTVDLIARVKGRLGIIDIKTGSAIRDEYALQTAAYFNAYNKSQRKDKQCKTRWILRIDQYAECRGCLARQRAARRRATGGNPLCNHVWSEQKAGIDFEEFPHHDQDLEAFLSAKELWEWYNRDWLKKIHNYPRKFLQKTLI